MAGLRKGHCYTSIERSYTRKSKFKSKSYIRGVPPNKIVKYDQGNTKKDFEAALDVKSKQPIQIRSNALESARQMINRRMSLALGTNYHLKIRVYPHHILRENKMLSGAGADRMQTGMQRAFGKAMGTAAQVKKGQPIITVHVDKKDEKIAKEALNAAIYRLPGKFYIE